jgi:hypothetical protein
MEKIIKSLFCYLGVVQLTPLAVRVALVVKVLP